MQKKDDTVRYTAEELADMSKRGETQLGLGEGSSADQ